MSEVHLRTSLRDDDVAAFSALTATSATAVIGERLMRDLLLAGSSEHSSVIVAERGERVLGYIHLALDHRDAWLVSGAVDPAHRRGGIGSRLLRATIAAARARGATHLRISGRAQGYAAPGVDADRDPGTARFLESHGAAPSGGALAMHRTLHDLEIALGEDAVAIAQCRVEDVPELLAVVREQLAANWADTLGRHVVADGALHRILLARGENGMLLGFAAWGVVGRDPARFGPFGVVPAARGRGAGGALLDQALLRMAGEGLAHAWFQWTGPGSPAHRLYVSRGFTPLRTFTPYTLAIAGGLAPAGSQEGNPL